MMNTTTESGDAARGPHDIGGLDLGPIDRTEHPRTLYEMRVDALLMLLTHPNLGAFRVDALRRAIESYSQLEYENLPYYDRWIKAIRGLLVEQGILTDAQIDARVAAIAAAAQQPRDAQGG
ncbi:MAG: nitrile hydratase subunit beta [Burkholderiales bacterium]|nr:MAG: nitrile hydratase subunit beta [Burkholderiales bacterium]